MRFIKYSILYFATLFLIANIIAKFENYKGITPLDSLSWILFHNHKDYPTDPDWKLPSLEQQSKDGLNFTSTMRAIEGGKLNSQAAYDELVRVKKLYAYHKLNLQYKFNTASVRVWAILLFLLFGYIYYKNRKKIKA